MGKEWIVEFTVRVTAKGHITIPKEVRDALGIAAGDHLIFRVQEGRAFVARVSRLLELAGAVPVPPGKRGVAWDEVIASTRRARAGR